MPGSRRLRETLTTPARAGKVLLAPGRAARALLRIRRRTAIGSPPGTLVSDPEAPPPILRVLAYDAERVEEATLDSPEALRPWLTGWPTVWANIDGLGDAEFVQGVGNVFGLHQLALEDVLNVYQRPKTEEYPDTLFIVVRMALLDAEGLRSEQVSMFLGRGFLVTFQEREGDCLDPVRERLRQGRGRIRVGGADYLAYAIIDAIVDNYYPVLEAYGERLEDLEDSVVADPGPRVIGQIHEIRRELLALRRAIWPLRDALGVLLREEHELVEEETRIYLRDCYDHTIQVIDLLENYREIASGLVDVYLSSVSNRMNEVMKMLTIIATIFIPLTFIVGVYGMNFDTHASRWNMPELGWRYGYAATWLVMLVIALGLVWYFRRKRWL